MIREIIFIGMILLFETGNTTTNVVIYNKKNLIHKWKIINNQINNENDFNISIINLLKLEDLTENDVEVVIISSVVRRFVELEEKFCKKNNFKFFNVKDPDVKLKFEARKTLGADVIADISAGIEIYKENFLIIDMGTATTFSVVGEKNKHLGDIYIAGVDTILKSLNTNCDLLPKIDIEEPKNILGKSTEEAMLSGIYYGYVGILKNIVETILKETQIKLKVILTGGYSKLFIDKLQFIGEVNENLTFDGLRFIYENNITNEKLWK